MEAILIILILIVIILIVGLYLKSTNGVCKSKKRLDGKTVIVTGGTTGMGLVIATDFADRGAKVIIACPFKNEGDAALELIKRETDSDNVIFKLLDLSSIESIREFASDIIKFEARLDILVNNAGVGAVPEFITNDGMNVIMQINYFGNVLLALLLMPLLKKTGTPLEPARIVNTSSHFHNFGTVNFKKLNKIKQYFPVQVYANSKLCLVLFSHELTKKLKGSKLNVVVNCVDPGYVGTRIFYCAGKVLGLIISTFLCVFSKTPLEGAQTVLYVSLDKKAGDMSGEFFKNCQLSMAKKSAYDDETARKLWNESIRLLKVSKEEIEKLLE